MGNLLERIKEIVREHEWDEDIVRYGFYRREVARVYAEARDIDRKSLPSEDCSALYKFDAIRKRVEETSPLYQA